MLACKILSLLVACISLSCLLMALVTDYWLVAYGPKDIAHSGLWKRCREGHCIAPEVPDDYIVATRALLILACLAASASAVSLVLLFIQCGVRNAWGSVIASVTAFTAGLCTLIAVVVYTAESWENKDAKIQRTYEWSFYLAWAAFPMLLLAGMLSLLLHFRSPASSYERILSKCPLILWFNGLDDQETCRLAGVILSCVATVLAAIAISTEFWVKRFVRGTFVFRGLWKDCQIGSCSRPAKVPSYLAFSIVLMLMSLVTSYGSVISGTFSFTPFPSPKKISWPCLTTSLSIVSGVTGVMSLVIFMCFAARESSASLSWSLAPGCFSVLAVSIAVFVVASIILILISLVTSYGSVISGTLCFTPLPRPRVISWPWLAIALCFVSGLTAATSLFNYMRFATRESSSYLSWSLAAGWLVVVVHFVAGICYFWASRWEHELLAENFRKTRTLMTLAEECKLMGTEECFHSRKMTQTSDTSL